MALYTMKEMLEDAKERGYAVGFFDAVNMEMTRAYIRAAEECDSPIIIGPAESLLVYGDFDWLAPVLLDAARRAKVPVAVHLDHGYSFDVMMRALRCGFGSIMFDGTRQPKHEDNVRISADLARIAHAMGAGLECELGSVSGLKDAEGKVDALVYTDPDEASEFVARTGADFLAVSIGTQHGVYKAEPRLDIPRLERIAAKVEIPLVLHGGSGLSDDDFRNTIAGGIRKINVYTDILLAAKKAIFENPDAIYTDLNLLAENAMKDACAAKLRLFGCAGKA